MSYSAPRKKSSSPFGWLLLAVALAVGAYFYLQDSSTPAAPATQVLPPPTPVEPPAVDVSQAPVPHYEPPVVLAPAAEPVAPLPTLNDSDAALLSELNTASPNGLVNLLVSPELLRKFVLAVNAAAEGKIVTDHRVLKSPPPPFVVEKFTVTIAGASAEQERVSARNFTRYDPYVTALSVLDADVAVALYKRFYPLLEEAYAELGLKKGNFHSVLIAAIDNLLATPEVSGDLLVIQPKIAYKYADPALEQLPQTQKLMLRMGPENTRAVKASLRRLRVKLLSE